MSADQLLQRWLRDNPVPWARDTPLGQAPIEVAKASDTPPGWLCFRNVADDTLRAVIPGTKYAHALRAVRLADDSGWAYEQVAQPGPGGT